MKRRLPPFAAVRAFEAAARHGSFTSAAEELNVTQSAISHQVKRLEEFLDTPLFVRAPQELTVTPAGLDYLAELTGILDRLDESTRRVCHPDQPELLRIRATPAFTTRWRKTENGKIIAECAFCANRYEIDREELRIN